MYEEHLHGYGDTCARLTKEINELRSLLQTAEQNEKLRANYEQKKVQHNANIRLCASVLDECKPLIANTKNYLSKKKTESLQGINNALRISGEIVQDSMGGVQFEIDKGEANIVDENGCEIQIMEGGGYRQISSTLIRSVVLGGAPQYLQTMFLDETFALVNDDNSATLSLYLQLISQNQQVISIEQKDSTYLNCDHECYTFKKAEKFSTVEHTVRRVESV